MLREYPTEGVQQLSAAYPEARQRWILSQGNHLLQSDSQARKTRRMPPAGFLTQYSRGGFGVRSAIVSKIAAGG
jgi:hypothetical protein